MKPKNNPKNRRSLLEFQKRQLELSRQTEAEAKKRRAESNLEKWVNFLPNELKFAMPTKLPKTVIEKIKETSLKPPYDKYTIVSAEDLAAARFTSYSIIYALIQGGLVTPSEVKITDIMNGYNDINGMFSSRKWKDYFFDENAKILLIEGTSKSLTLLGSKGEEQFWREILEFTKNNDKLVIITYATEENEKDKNIFIPLLTSNKDLNFKIIKKSTFVRLSNEEEGEIKDE